MGQHPVEGGPIRTAEPSIILLLLGRAWAGNSTYDCPQCVSRIGLDLDLSLSLLSSLEDPFAVG